MNRTRYEQATWWDTLGRDHSLMSGLVVAVLLLLLTWVLTGFYWLSFPPEVPLFYSLPLGPDQLANKHLVWLIPIIPTVSLILWLLFFRLALFLYLIYHQLMVWLVGLTAFLSLVAIIHIAILVL